MNSGPIINAVVVQGVTVQYGSTTALSNIDCTVPAGMLCAIIGPNGAGKSTLLKTMVGLIKPFAGSVLMYGMSPQQFRKECAYIPQAADVDWDFPITVLEVVLMGCYSRLGWFGRPSAQDYQDALQMLKHVDLAEHAQRRVRELSGGQRQRLFLARALLQRAQIYLCDEPFAGVDFVSEQLIMQQLKQLCAAGKTVIMVHHDLQMVANYFDWVIFLSSRSIACGPTERMVQPDYVCQAYGTQSFYVGWQMRHEYDRPF